MLKEINDFLLVWEPLWLLTVLLGEGLIGYITLTWVRKEFYYDKEQDDMKKSRRTKTSKKTTQAKDGSSIVEESSEVIEPSEKKGEAND